MSGKGNTTGLNDCGCCKGLDVKTPMGIDNRAGLDAISYRIGTHASFKASMLAQISDAAYPALASLRVRNDDDFTIALLDAWATVADVLTFYQERIANESYLRTATELFSIHQLARLIGYEPSPGVAASTDLAFTLDLPPALPDATPALSKLQRPVKPLTIQQGTKVQSIPGPDETAQIFETIESIEALAQWNAMKPRMRVQQTQVKLGATQLYLQGVNTRLEPGSAILIVGDDRLINKKESNHWDMRILDSVQPVADPNGIRDLDYTRVTWKDPLGEDPISPASVNVKVYALRRRAALFGHNAPDPNVLVHSTDTSLPIRQLMEDPKASDLEWKGFKIPGKHIDLDAEYPEIIEGGWVVLDTAPTAKDLGGYRELYKIDSVTTPSRTDYALSGKVTRFETDTTVNIEKFGLRKTTVFAQDELLHISAVPVDPKLAMGVDTLALDSIVPQIPVGQQILVTGKRWDSEEIVSEMVVLQGQSEVEGVTELQFSPPLGYDYLRSSVEFNANIANATHGESVIEVLGSGDSTQVYQRFVLKQIPLTYVSDASPAGAASTLQVYVNDILWHEVPYLYDLSPDDRVFITRTDGQGQTVIQFGDGVNGARLPTGQDNVRAQYRKGIGLGGMVEKSQLSQLMAPQLGLKAVTNPFKAEGAQDPESRDQARDNAPLTVLTLDRAVSLQDYEDYARAFAGIAKAHAVWLWDGRQRVIFITVAGEQGQPLDENGTTLTNLKDSFARAGDPYVQFQIANYQDAKFRLGATVKVHPDYLPDNVLGDAEAALRSAYSFEARDFGQHVALSEVVMVMQAVPGVVAVNVDWLYPDDGTGPAWNPRLISELPSMGADGVVAPARLLTLHPDPLEKLEVMA